MIAAEFEPAIKPDRRRSRRAPTSLDGFAVVASSASNSDTAVLKPVQAVQARYLLVWLTRLPAVSGGFRGGIADLAVLSPS